MGIMRRWGDWWVGSCRAEKQGSKLRRWNSRRTSFLGLAQSSPAQQLPIPTTHQRRNINQQPRHPQPARIGQVCPRPIRLEFLFVLSYTLVVVQVVAVAEGEGGQAF